MKKIILLAFQFPPFPGVGVFRWAQMCKYLALLGHEIHVVTVDWKCLPTNTLLEAVQHPNIHIHKIASGYPHNFLKKDFQNRILNGFRNKLFIHGINKFYPHDFAQRWDKTLLPYVQDLIDTKDINVVIATGSPFMVNVHAATLRRNNPKVRLIQDMRDAWFSTSASQVAEFINEKKDLEMYALQHADLIVTVTDGLEKKFSKVRGDTSVITIRNGYDPEKFILKQRQAKTSLHFVHLGNINRDRVECCDPLWEYMRRNPNCTASFAGVIPNDIFQATHDLVSQNRLSFLGVLNQDKCIKLLDDASFGIHFNGRIFPEAASTKLYEYVGAGCPVLSFNFGGESEYLILKYNLGISINIENSLDCATELEKKLTNFDYANLCPEVTEEFSYKNLAEKYSSVINTI